MMLATDLTANGDSGWKPTGSSSDGPRGAGVQVAFTGGITGTVVLSGRADPDMPPDEITRFTASGSGEITRLPPELIATATGVSGSGTIRIRVW